MTHETPFLGEFPFILAGEPRTGETYALHCPHDGVEIARVHRPGPAELAEAVRAAVAGFEATRALPPFRRAEILRAVAQSIRQRAEELARTMALEAAKPIRQARVEIGRSAFIFAAAAEEATRLRDEIVHLDANPGGLNRLGILRRFPVGPVAAVTPFNFPLNQVAHKLAPAMAAGCSVVLKPASQTPLMALELARMVLDAGWPKEALSLLPLRSADAAPLVEDPRFKLLTFTGSAEVGWDMKRRAGKKKVTLELGGNAGVIVHHDADLNYAAERCTAGGFFYAGQSCISVQRIFVHRSVYDKFLVLFLPRVKALVAGHPLDESADLCAMISRGDAERVAGWLSEAREAGARFLVGGGVRDGVVEPTVIADASPRLSVNSREVFAPVVTVQPYTEFTEALHAVNDSDFGLQAGVFTRDVKLLFDAFSALEVGGVMANEVPTWRVDQMPYGGVKDSGTGREGIRWAVEEMTEPKLMALNLGIGV